ncbi:helix-turn-helix domain-containing protein [Staphylococcus hominis]|uniref:helix-turn-helix domain-containing protein n=1 Tax=Staphylococcus hominis TaxID=1290 RepID=UPI001F582151|nr:helix-turn-helix transcriptional regulator [Staphylococcus hominis]MCI2889330.1 helix-turn-helix domain-containing protein [Staphylococcus hominis]MCI2893706.1 helix-turn-helix domain-containing protein [Staphylococcus hominis]
MNEFGKKIKELRGKESIRSASRHIGISHTYLDSLEKGIDPRTGKERKPTIEVINKISLYYDYDFFELCKLADLFVPIKDVPKEQLKMQFKQFKKKFRYDLTKNEIKLKKNYANFLNEKWNYEVYTFMNSIYEYIVCDSESNSNEDLIYISSLIKVLNENKNSKDEAIYNDIIESFKEFLKNYINI